MGSNIDQNQTVTVTSESHGTVIEHECSLYTSLFKETKGRMTTHKVKAILFKGEINHVICEHFDIDNFFCKSDHNDNKRCIFIGNKNRAKC